MAISAPADFPNDGDGLFARRYRLIAVLKRGGMGVTYRAWDTRLGMPVVIKMPNENSRSDGAAMRRFAREIEAMLRLEHDHIVPIGNHGEEYGCPFVVMPLLPGGSLADMRRRDKNGNVQPQVPGTLQLWLPSVASALDFIHGRGLLHRDVKPGNIFFDGFWNAFLGDFGIAKVVDDSGGVPKGETLTATLATIGTPEYMAPELFRPKAGPDSRSDQYALAVTVYEMLAGEKPFTGADAHIVVEQSTMPVPPLASRAQGLPASLCAAVEKALSKRPEDRFKTCGDFAAAALRDVLPSPREPNMARLLCPSCSTILRLPTSAGGKTGKCPNCKAEMRIAKDLSALWLAGEEDGNRAAPSGQQFEAVTFDPTAGEGKPLADDLAASPHVASSGPRRQFTWIIGPMLAAVALSMIAGLLSHMWWKAYQDRQIAALSAEHNARSQAVEGEWQKKLAAAEQKIVEQKRDREVVDSRVLELIAEVAFLTKKLTATEAELKNAGPQGSQVKASADEADQVEDMKPADRAKLVNAASINAVQAQQLVSTRKGQLIELNSVRNIDAEVAAILAKHNAAISLSGLTSLSNKVCESFSRHGGRIALNGVRSLSSEAVSILANTSGFLSFDSLETLPNNLSRESLQNFLQQLYSLPPSLAEIAMQRLRSESERSKEWPPFVSVDFSGVQALQAETAAVIADNSNDATMLYLDGLSNLDDEASRELGLFRGPYLSLSGLRQLSPTAVKNLGRLRSRSLDLNLSGLKELTVPLAVALGEHQGELILDGVESLNAADVQALASHKDHLSLKGLKRVVGTRGANLNALKALLAPASGRNVDLPQKFEK
jgi:serine/threonine protein kinase